MKNTFWLLMIFSLLLPGMLRAEGFQFGYVDGAALIGMHPLMRQFNPETRRFVDTVSQPLPSENPAEFIERLRGRLEEQKKLLVQLDANYADKLTGTGLAARKAWWAFWKRRESLRIYQTLIQEAMNQAATQGNFYLNMPSDWTVMPVAMAIAASVNDACEYLRAGNDLGMVIDTSVLIKNRPADEPMMQVPNGHWQIWRAEPFTAADLQRAGSSMQESIARLLPGRAVLRPIVAGAMDLNPLAVSLLENITLPSAELPDAEKR